MCLVIHTINHLSRKNILIKNQLLNTLVRDYYKNKAKTSLYSDRPVDKLLLICCWVVPKPHLKQLATTCGGGVTYPFE